MFGVSILNMIMGLLDRYPQLVRTFLSPVANAPLLSNYIKVLPRAFMGATAFEIHKVDIPGGRISIGGVDEVIFSSKFIELFHKVIAEHCNEDEKNRILYDIGRQGGNWEVSEAIRHGRWAPRVLVQIIEDGKLIDSVRSDPAMARLFGMAMKMIMRLIINEGGWGASEIELGARPIRVTLANSQEARWLGPATKPVCYISAGVIAGYTSRMLKEELHAREVACAAMGAPHCVFEIDR